jgi:hypothetical protein
MAQPTPGPWTFDEAMGEVITADAHTIIAVVHGDPPGRADDANGYLLAAAPELLQWAKWTLAHLERLQPPLEGAEQLRAVIAKAAARGPHDAECNSTAPLAPTQP